MNRTLKRTLALMIALLLALPMQGIAFAEADQEEIEVVGAGEDVREDAEIPAEEGALLLASVDPEAAEAAPEQPAPETPEESTEADAEEPTAVSPEESTEIALDEPTEVASEEAAEADPQASPEADAEADDIEGLPMEEPEASQPFRLAATVEAVAFVLTVPAGAYPEDAALSVTPVSDETIARAAAEALSPEGEAEHRLYRVQVVDAAGEALRPGDGFEAPTLSVVGLGADARVAAYVAEDQRSYALAAWREGEGLAFPLANTEIYDFVIGMGDVAEVVAAEEGEPGEAEPLAEAVEAAAFEQSATVDGVTVTVRAEADAFPEGATLSVVKVSAETAEAVDAAVADAQGGAQAAVASYTFDISVVDAEGRELQPAEGRDVQVSFALAEAAQSVEASVYHIHEAGGDMTAEALDIVDDSGDTVTALTDGFSLYNLTLLAANDAPTAISLSYVDAKGNAKEPVICELLTDGEGVTLDGGWYAVQGSIRQNGRITVKGRVNLLLCNNATLDVTDSIIVESADSLTIWAQSTGSNMGKLIATTTNYVAGIGGKLQDSTAGAITINGGHIEATGGRGAAGIGGANVGSSSSITINGGNVTAAGGESGAGIGGGRSGSGGNITITGGTVKATGKGGAAGIGGGVYKDFADITISGGTVSADVVNGYFDSEDYKDGPGAGIGSGASCDCTGNITIRNATVTAVGGTQSSGLYKGYSGAGIGSGMGSPRRGDLEGCVITIENATVTARGGGIDEYGAAGIGSGCKGNAGGGTVKIINSTVYAYGGPHAAGIGGGREHINQGGEGAKVEISGSNTYVLALSGEGKASAIGHGENDSDYGTIDLAANMSVKGAWSEEECKSSEPFPWDTRVLACQYRWCAIVQSCEHPAPVVDNLPVIPFDSITATTHRRSACKYCRVAFEDEPHDLIDGVCSVCGYSEDGFRLSFDGNGGEGGMESFFVAQGQRLGLPDCLFTPPQNTRFIGWKIGDKTYKAGEAVTIDRDMIAVAQWSAPLTITLYPGEGTGDPVSVPASEGDKYPLPPYTDCNFTEPEWHLFVGWAVNGDETNLKQPLETVTIAGDTTVTAIWERPEYAITFDSNGGSVVSNQHALRGAHASKPPVDPTREGFTFKDWYLDNEPFDFENTPIIEDITLTAVWLNPWETLQARIDAAAEEETIALDGDVTAEAVDEAITIPAGKAITLDLAGHTLSRGLTEAVEDGNAITMKGSLTMTDSGTGGAITGGINHGNGGGVVVANGGALTLNGGTITGNTADGTSLQPANGGGVYIENGGSFTMNGGAVTGNKTQMNVKDNHGGGVYVGGSFILNGGVIKENNALMNGGGVCVDGGAFKMTGGEITGNKAVYYGGGVNYTAGTLKLSGAPVITGNTGRGNAANNLYLAEGRTVTVTGTLTGEQPIGVSMETPGVFTSGLTDYGTADSFVSDDSACGLGVNEAGEVYLDGWITVTFDTDGGSTVEPQKIVKGAIPVRPEDPAREGVTFKEWQKEDGSAYNFDTPLTEDTTLKAAYYSAWSLLQKQIDEADSGATIALSDNVTAGADEAALTIPAGKAITLDLAGHTLSRGLTKARENGNVITVKGSLTVTDSGKGGTITGGNNVNEGGGIVLYNDENSSALALTLNGGSITGNVSEDRGGGVYMESVEGSFTMNGGSIADNTSASDGGGVAVMGGSFTMNGGSVSGNTSEDYGGGVFINDKASVFTMKDGAVICDNTANYGGGVNVEYGTFIMNDGSISDNTAEYDGGGVYMMDADFTMKAGTVKGNEAKKNGGGVYSEDEFTMTGGVISENYADYDGGGVYSEYAFTMNGGKVINNTADNHGGGVYMMDADLTMTDGTISKNGAGADGGGVYIKGASSVFAMTSSGITDNTAGGEGGGVFMYDGSFTMNSGSITGNTAKGDGGGGVYTCIKCNFTLVDGEISNNVGGIRGGGVCAESNFTMKGGEITGNTADYQGGGVYAEGDDYFTMTGGSIKDNHIINSDGDDDAAGGGVYVDGSTAFSLSGNVDISGNKLGDKDNNVYLKTGKVITVGGELTNATPIGIAMQTPGVFTSGLSGNGTAANFASDDTAYGVGVNEDGEALLASAFTVKFVNEDGTELQSGELAYGATPAYTGETPAKAATEEYTYTFTGWTPEIASVSGAATYTATFAREARKYTVKFVNWDGTELQSSEVAYGETPEYTGETPTKADDNSIFTGWSPEIAAVKGEATYTATYSEVLAGSIFTVRFLDADGKSELLNEQRVNAGDTAIEPPAPVKDGAFFDGWRLNGAEYDFNTPVTQDIELTASWADAAVIQSASASFEGRILLNFYLKIPQAIMADTAAYATITGGEEGRKDQKETILLSEATKTNDGYYRFTHAMMVKELTDKVVLRLYDGKGELIPIVGGESKENYTDTGVTYSLKRYFDVMSNSDDAAMKDLAIAARDYCLAAKIYFKYGDVGGEALSGAVSDVKESTLSGYASKRSGELPDGVTIQGITGMFESDNTLRLYLSFEDGAEPKDFTYTIGGQKAEIFTKTSGEHYLAKAGGVAANHLGDTVNYVISGGGKTHTVTASVLTYARSSVLNGNAARKNLGKALYLYNKAAIAKFGTN